MWRECVPMPGYISLLVLVLESSAPDESYMVTPISRFLVIILTFLSSRFCRHCGDLPLPVTRKIVHGGLALSYPEQRTVYEMTIRYSS